MSLYLFLQIPVREEMVVAQETPDRVGKKAGLERVLGLLKRHYVAVLPMRLTRRSQRRSGSKTPNHRRRRHHATYPRTSQKRLHLLSQHGVW